MAHAEAALFGPAVAALLGVVGLDLQRHRSPASSPRASRSGIGEAGNFPAVDQDRRGVVPEARARVRHRDLQLRHQHRRGGDAAGGAVDHLHLGLVLGLHRHRRARFPLAGRVVVRSTAARGASAGLARRSSPTSAAIRRTRWSRMPWARCFGYRQTWAFALGKFLHRSGLVAVPVLDSRLPQPQLRHQPVEGRPAADRDLPDRRHRQHRRRLAVVGADQARLDGQRRRARPRC